jgi:hypothetical protein
MYKFDEFQSDVIRIAKNDGYTVEYLRGTNIPQIDFGHKKLHGNHLRELFPRVLADNANINKLIEKVAPGRPCAHAPFRKIVRRIKNEHPEACTAAVLAG